jgi:hypothetical protein
MLCLLPVAALAMFCFSCSTTNRDPDTRTRMALTNEIYSAASYLQKLRAEGNLPGIDREASGWLRIGSDDILAGRPVLPQNIYPINVDAHWRFTNSFGLVTNAYYLTKQQRGAPWRLKGASLMDEHGQFTELKL